MGRKNPPVGDTNVYNEPRVFQVASGSHGWRLGPDVGNTGFNASFPDGSRYQGGKSGYFDDPDEGDEHHESDQCGADRRCHHRADVPVLAKVVDNPKQGQSRKDHDDRRLGRIDGTEFASPDLSEELNRLATIPRGE